MTHAVLPKAINGLTTAQNSAVTATSTGLALRGPTHMISVGTLTASSYPIYIMFGGPNMAALLTSTTGFRISAGWVGRIDTPPNATHIYFLRAEGNDSDISLLECDGGI